MTGSDSAYSISFITHSPPPRPGVQWCKAYILNSGYVCNGSYSYAPANEIIEFFYPHEDDIEANSTDCIILL